MLKKIYRDRLEKVADHLKYGKLGHKIFDFSVINENVEGTWPKGNTCGTNGCAIGELPIIFPKYFKFEHDQVIKIGTEQDFWDFYTWFGLNPDIYTMLFHPGEYRIWNKKVLLHNASRKQVAQSIREFLEWDRLGYYEAWLALNG